MEILFPSPLSRYPSGTDESSELKMNTNSCENAIRLILRSYQLSSGSKIGVPALVCDSVMRSVSLEGLTPYFMDTQAAHFWTDVTQEQLKLSGIRVLILVHYYGELHPNTKQIEGWCEALDIKLIHDAAQSYGIDQGSLSKSCPVVYSYSPGKSTTAAEGGSIHHFPYSEYTKYLEASQAPEFILTAKAKFFIASRSQETILSTVDKLLTTLYFRVFRKKTLSPMCRFQRVAASEVIANQTCYNKSRSANMERFQLAVKDCKSVTVLNTNPSSYKLVLLVDYNRREDFAAHCTAHELPYFILLGEDQIKVRNSNNLICFPQVAKCIFEFSTESTLKEDRVQQTIQMLTEFN